ncbi:hypothetical protein M378DRAFT_77583 [Amanita muscaria Koide BX008]|uniref:Autophagy-related protein 14 n=1 Tax=Amanita muscaria (strain Koide BX008) TaxID=946122 RepID=A0A0C2TDB4_AMAMK|nr:hypothetical protein M378DRAFT_77583 [Amanita muscaria Koide BX008]
MDCKTCELSQRQFYCDSCIRTHLRDLRRQIQHFSIDRDEQLLRSSRALDTVSLARVQRADVSSHQQQLDQVQAGLVKLRKENDKRRDRLRLLRESLATRRRNISAAKLVHSSSTTTAASTAAASTQQPTPSLGVNGSTAILSLAHIQSASRERQELTALSITISRARSGLVQELVEVFNVVEAGGRPPIGGKPGTKGEWKIGDLVLPVPGDMRRYPPDHINAVMTHTIHFLSLLTFYLGVKLPFQISWTSGKLGVGQPWIGAGNGPETGGWARWTSKHCLHVSASVPSIPPSTIIEQSSSSPPNLSTLSPSSPPGNQSILQESTYHEQPSPHDSGTGGSSFMTALAMLIYNVTYLAFTQGVDIPLNQAGDLLSNLWRVCCSAELGKKSHETTPLLSSPTPATFPLEFSQLLQATTANPSSRGRFMKHVPHNPPRSRSTPTSTAAAAAGRTLMHSSTDYILEEEDEGWNLVGARDGWEDPDE